MKKIKLETILKQDGKKPDDIIKWAYYGYGFLSCTGECTVNKLPPQVKFAIFTEKQDDVYCVDGAL